MDGPPSQLHMYTFLLGNSESLAFLPTCDERPNFEMRNTGFDIQSVLMLHFLSLSRRPSAELLSSVIAPARDVLKLQVQDFWTERANPNEYMGMTDSADAAWHELMQSM
jgi:hypothetical protein